MEGITLQPPAVIRERIAACEQELRALRRLLRMSVAANDAAEARQQREQTPAPEVRRAHR